MAFSYNTPFSHIRHALGGVVNEDLNAAEIINGAGEYLVSMRPWRWCEDAISYLDFRANVSFTGATWANATNLLTKTGAFTNYIQLPGDVVEITGGTGVYTGYYRVVSNTAYSSGLNAANTIVLQTDPTVQQSPQGEHGGFDGPDRTGSDPTDVSGTLHAEGVALPPDFAELIAYHSTSGLLQGLQMTSHADLLQKRASAMSMPLGFHYATIVQPAESLAIDSAEATRPHPRLELWPAPSANENGALQIVYRRGWKSVFNDIDSIPIPTWVEALYLEVVRAFSLGWEESDVATLDQRLGMIAQGPLYAAAIERDSSVQPDFGPLINGAVALHGASSPFQNFNSVTAPS